MSRHRLRLSVAALALLYSGVTTASAEPLWPTQGWTKAEPADVGMDAAQLRKARDYALTGGGSGYITRRGKLVITWGDPARRYDLKSTTKSFGATALGVAMGDEKMKLTDKAVKFFPDFGKPPESNAETGWLEKITLEHLATHTAGFQKPGGFTKLTYEPGTRWAYSDGGPNWLADCITLTYKQDLQDWMFKRVFRPLGITSKDLRWRNNSYRPRQLGGVARREFGSGIHANVDAMARVGYLYLRRGKWEDRQILPESFIDVARTTLPAIKGLKELDAKRFGNASDHYGLLWWNNNDGTLQEVPRDAYWSWGLHESLILVIPSLDVVASRAGRSWKRSGDGHYDVLRPFFGPIARGAGFQPAKSKAGSQPAPQTKAPYPPSRVITGITWAAASSIVRKARGGDNWPITWADDDHLYTAYGDGRGFKPLVPRKLSMGLARVEGTPDRFTGINVRSPTAEHTGGGPSGKKASGMLMVDGVLYMWVRNADNAQLAWSKDHGKTWSWSDWRWTTSFGHPTFLNFGKNYAGARDKYVYTYSHDHDSAYRPADRMVLARAPRDELTRRESYEFFAGLDDSGKPTWHRDLARRKAAFEHPGRCYRSGISYNAGLRRYLWCQIIPGGDTRFRGGIGIYEAPEPWGPWTTVFFTERWDVGPGECASFPTKWMSDDGRTLHLVFSGDDCFSVRRARLTTRETGPR